MNVWRNYKKALEVEKAMAKAGGIHPLIAQEGITRAEYQLAWYVLCT